MTISIGDKVCRAEGAISANLDHDCIVLDIMTGRYLQLNPIAAAIWNAVESPLAVGDICRQLEAKFEAPTHTIEAEVITFLETLHERKLLTVVAAL